jgi:aminoglycoside 6'-N-acetyltransferase I
MAYIRPLRPGERTAWLDLRAALWPDAPRESLIREQEEILADPARNTVLAAVEEPTGSGRGELIGFVEVSLRDWAEGCDTRPVGYLEAWYVVPEHRRAGLGRQLIDAAEAWALSRGCTEMGSDADLDNRVSHAAHRALGYAEVTRLVLFCKRIAP